MAQPIAIAIHGGAGNIRPENLPPDKAQKVEAYLRSVVEESYTPPQKGGRALVGGESRVPREGGAGSSTPGGGAVPTGRGKANRVPATRAGQVGRAGAVAAVKKVRNPISLARLVMERTPHVLIVGEGADSLARAWELPLRNEAPLLPEVPWSYGTVGAVALDKYGNLAAATSTGGISGKMAGRVGDSPLIGAGTYAENDVIALSATGQGEYFIRSVLAYEVAARIRYQQTPATEAIRQAFAERLEPLGGQGGVIAVTPSGEVLFHFNTPGMYRAGQDAQGRLTVGIFR